MDSSCVLLNFIGIGTELLNEIQQVMREDKEKAVKEAVSQNIEVITTTTTTIFYFVPRKVYSR